MPERIEGLSMNIEQENINRLHKAFPECFTEGKLDVDKLLSLCGEYIMDDFEKYEFKWKGKSNCLRLAQKRSTATLRPVPEDSVNWDTTQNLYIEGDNLEVLKLLQKSYFRKIKMIYIDPPYNTGNDFVYEDDFADPLARYMEVTFQTTKSNPETMGRYHTNWLNMMYPRLRLASNLLRDDGVIFISIDDNEVTNLRRLCNEVFGEENFVAQLIWHSRQNKDNRNITGVSVDHEYILCYSKQFGERIFRGTDRKTDQYSNPDNDSRGPWTSANMVGLATADARPNLHYDLINPTTGVNYGCPPKGWRYDRNTMKRLIEENRIIWPDSAEGRPRKKAFLYELTDNLPGYSSILREGIYTNTATKEVTRLFDGEHWFDFPKPSVLIEDLISQVTDGDDIILDFFSGSASTAHAVMQLNLKDNGARKFIMVQLPELCDINSDAYRAGFKTICEIGKERIRRVGRITTAENEGLKSIVSLETPDDISLFTMAAAKGEKGIQAVTPLFKTCDHSNPTLDVGFKVFRLDSSNIQTWDDTPVDPENIDALLARIDTAVENLKSDRSDADLIYEILLKLGYPLTADVAAMDVDGLTVYTVENNDMLVCLQAGVTAEHVEHMASFEPRTIVLAENVLADNSTMSNAHYLLENRGIELTIM